MDITTNTVQVLTGSTIAILATFVYSALTRAFLSGGSFRKKWEAVFITLGTAFALGMLTPSINEFWREVIPQITYLQLVGVLIMVGTFSVNQMVHNWRHSTGTSIILYGAGLILFGYRYI